MTSPVNSGWQVAPVMMNHEPDGWKAIPFATISSTSFSFEETVAEEWTITNKHNAPISFTFAGETQEAIRSCLIKPAKGTVAVGEKLSGTVSAKSPVDNSQQWEMKLTITDGKHEQVIDIVINRSKRDKIKEKTSKAGSSMSGVSTPTGGPEKRLSEGRTTAGILTPPPSRLSEDRPSEKTLDFTFVVMFAITLSIIFIIHDIVQLPWLVHPTFVALISFVMGAMTYAYSGPFKEWISVTTLNRLTSKPKVKKA